MNITKKDKKNKVLVLRKEILSKDNFSKSEKIKIIKTISNADYIIFNTVLDEVDKNLLLFIRIAKMMKNTTFGIFTTPFRFEGKLKHYLATKNLTKLENSLNYLFLIDSDEVINIMTSRICLENARKIVNEVKIRNINILKYFLNNNLPLSSIEQYLLFDSNKLNQI